MSTCPRCGTTFACGMVEGGLSGVTAQACWCMQGPPPAPGKSTAPATITATACFCPACLRLWHAERAALAVRGA